MQDLRLIYEYIFQFHRLPMEGLGELLLTRNSATLRMLDKQIDPPVYHIEFSAQSTDNTHFIHWLSDRLSVSYNDAETVLKGHIQQVLAGLQESGIMQWGKLGEWLKNETGNIYFKGSEITLPGQIPLKAEKLIRGNVDHKVLIGDQTYSGEKLHALLEKNKKKLTRGASTLLLSGSVAIAAVFILYCLVTMPGFRISHQFHSKLHPKNNQETYKIINPE